MNMSTFLHFQGLSRHFHPTLYSPHLYHNAFVGQLITVHYFTAISFQFSHANGRDIPVREVYHFWANSITGSLSSPSLSPV